MGLLKGLMINQAPAQARISSERGLATPWPRVLCGCYSWATIKPYQARAGVRIGSGQAGGCPIGGLRRITSSEESLATYSFTRALSVVAMIRSLRPPCFVTGLANFRLSLSWPIAV